MKNKYLTLSDRNDIQLGIEQITPLEVRRNRVVKENSVISRQYLRHF